MSTSSGGSVVMREISAQSHSITTPKTATTQSEAAVVSDPSRIRSPNDHSGPSTLVTPISVYGRESGSITSRHRRKPGKKSLYKYDYDPSPNRTLFFRASSPANFPKDISKLVRLPTPSLFTFNSIVRRDQPAITITKAVERTTANDAEKSQDDESIRSLPNILGS